MLRAGHHAFGVPPSPGGETFFGSVYIVLYFDFWADPFSYTFFSEGAAILKNFYVSVLKTRHLHVIKKLINEKLMYEK
jgi:hypothetical protein